MRYKKGGDFFEYNFENLFTALLGKRSYKETFSKDDIIKILKDMSGTKIDADIVIDNYDNLINTLYENCKEVFSQYRSINKNYEHIQRIFFDKYK